jgi:hypothetical protein
MSRANLDFWANLHENSKLHAGFRYDDAIQVGIKALENKPTDEVVYQQIAIVYLILELATSAVTDPTDETGTLALLHRLIHSDIPGGRT